MDQQYHSLMIVIKREGQSILSLLLMPWRITKRVCSTLGITLPFKSTLLWYSLLLVDSLYFSFFSFSFLIYIVVKQASVWLDGKCTGAWNLPFKSNFFRQSSKLVTIAASATWERYSFFLFYCLNISFAKNNIF